MYDSMPPIYKVQLNSLIDAVNLAFQYIKKEKYNDALCNYLINNATSEEEISLLNSIKCDMKKHQNFLKNFYLYFTGKPIISEDISFKIPSNYIEGIKKAFLDNQSNIELFTKLYNFVLQSICNENFTNMIFEILQDVQKHSEQYNFILNLNILKNVKE